jgi:hypothetical protein
MSRGNILPRAAFAAFATIVTGSVASPALATDAPPFEAPRERQSYERALECLTQAIYFEARSESEDGQRAVAQVVLNRVRHPSYPNSVCGVVFQGSHRTTGCQFSFTCDGSLRPVTEGAAWARAERIATAALRGYVYRPVGLSLNYHTTAIRPYWAPSLIRQTVIGAHIFYRQPGSGSLASFRQEPASFEPSAGSRGVATAARTSRTQIDRLTREFLPARVEMARVERPRVERAVFERPPGFGPPARRQAAARRSTPGSAQAPVARRGPRTTVEGGVRVARGS